MNQLPPIVFKGTAVLAAPFYRKDIDGLRAIAVLMVLFFHFGILGARGAGFLGVDVFFVISGYLITSIIYRELAAGSFDLKRFYLNRVRRLAPALFATLFLVLAVGIVWLFPSDMISLAKQVIAAQLYVSNFYYWRTLNYFGLAANSAYLLHTWSLAVEEQFYLIYPLGLMLTFKFARRHLWSIIAAALVISFLLNIFFVARKPEATFYLLPTRAWELLVGALIVYFERDISFKRHMANVICLLGVALIGVSFVFLDTTYRFPGWAALCPTLGAALIILSGGKNSTSVALSNPVMTYVGRISYPLYLVHWPITIFASEMLGERYQLAWRTVMLLASVAIASAIYHLIERPIRVGAVIRGRNALAFSYMAGLAVSLSVCIALYEQNGLPQRFAPEVSALAAFADDRPPDAPECQFNGDPKRFCQIGDLKITPTWLIYGDSHAWAAKEAFDIWLKDNRQSALFSFMQSCPPIEGVHLYHDGDVCFAFNESALALLKRTPSINKVFLVSIWRQIFSDLSTSVDVSPTPSESIKLFQDRFAVTLRDLNNAGEKVYIWEPLPGSDGSAPQSLARIAAGQRVRSAELTTDEYMRTFGAFFAVLDSNRRMIAGQFSPSEFLCNKTVCAISIDGKPLYFDSNHLARGSSHYLASQLEMQINLHR